tara:strand:+ start:41 stop:226 length:186 start_codon:yes stop_codon:yes gene_type:complete
MTRTTYKAQAHYSELCETYDEKIDNGADYEFLLEQMNQANQKRRDAEAKFHWAFRAFRKAN